MKTRINSAHVLALIAIVLALGGNAVAFTLGKNSVGTKQLKRNAVTKVKVKKNAIDGRRVKNNSLTGADINLSKLGTVPSAKNASTANTASMASVANSLAPSEAWHEVGAPGEPGYQNEWEETYLPGTTETTAFYKDHENIVHLRGIPDGPAGTAIFYLPPGYRPAIGKIIARPVVCTGCPEPEAGVALMHVRGDNGAVEAPGGPGYTSVFLEGISFRAES